MNAKIPAGFPVQPLKRDHNCATAATCGTCGRSWDDAKATEYTPAPSGRCPFEYFHGSRRRAGSRKNTLCFSAGGRNPFNAAPRGSSMIELRQQGRDCFSVRYGLQLKTGLDYASAARELGACIMHMQACDGMLDNREKGER